VDSILLGFAAGVLYPLLASLLAMAGVPSMAWVGSIPSTVGVFVAMFYAALAGTASLRARGDRGRRTAWVAGGVTAFAVAGAVVVLSAGRLAAHREVVRKVAEYELETGKSGDAVESDIALSLHGFNSRPRELALDSLGRVVVAGDFTFYGGHEAPGIARILQDGTLDRTLSRPAPGSEAFGQFAAVRPLADGALLVAVREVSADYSSAAFVLRTLEPSGALSPRPGVPVGTPQFSDGPSPFDVQPDGAIVVGRVGPPQPDETPACVRRFRADGGEDLEFAARVGLSLDSTPASDFRSCTVTALRVQPDGRILVVNSGLDSEGVWRDGLLHRLFADGTLDTAFAPAFASVAGLAVGERGEIFVAAVPSGAAGPSRALFKLRADGTPDDAFAAEFANNVLALQRDGRLLVAGRFDDPSVVRLMPDGRRDAAFGAGGSVTVHGSVTQIVEGGAGEIYLIGDFYDVGRGTAALRRYQIARLRPDGAPDELFDPR
jgi:uncharacterized delta-60 repeat protein